jgi:hypothetical protein
MHYKHVIFFNAEWQGMKIVSTVFDALNTGKDFVTNNIQFVNPIKILSTERFQTTTDDSGQDTSGSNLRNTLSKVTDVSGNISKITGYFSRLRGTDASVNPVPLDASGNIPKPKQSTTVKIIKGIGIFIYVCLVLLLASLVANHLIMQPVFIRVLMFTLTLFSMIINPIILLAVLIYYIFFACTRFYFNTTLPIEQKKSLLPYQFALLPVTTQKAKTTLGYLLMYPFAYELPELESRLLKERNNFLESIEQSFPNFAVMSTLEGFNDLYSKFKDRLNDMHTFKVTDDKGVEVIRKPFTNGIKAPTVTAPLITEPPAPVTQPPAPQPLKESVANMQPSIAETVLESEKKKTPTKNLPLEDPIVGKKYIVNDSGKKSIARFESRGSDREGTINDFVKDDGQRIAIPIDPPGEQVKNPPKYQPVNID